LTVIDIGANIGYYALQPVALTEDCQVLAIEADAENVRMLRENVELNGYQDSTTIREVAVGAKERTGTLIQATHSNRHTLQEQFETVRSDITAGQSEVEVVPLTKILREEGIVYNDVDVIRMDVEGFEASILKGAEPVSDASDSLLMNVEVHMPLLDEEELEYILRQLQGAEIISASLNNEALEIADVSELPDYGTVELIVRL